MSSKIQSHEIQDIYRIQDGLLLVVNKYIRLGHNLYGKSKGKTKQQRGCKGLTITTADITDKFLNVTYPIGTLLLNGSPVRATADINRFKFEIKSSGGTIEGSITEVRRSLQEIENIIGDYKEERE